MDGSQPTSISAQDLYRSIGTAVAPIVIDVRRSAAFAADNRMIVGAVRRNPEEVQDWRRDLPSGRVVVVYCVRGQEMSQGAASALQAAGVDACYLENGIAGWAEHRLPMRNKRETEPRSWVTRERPKIDRIAVPGSSGASSIRKPNSSSPRPSASSPLPARPGLPLTTSPAPSLSRTTASCVASMPS
jgi:rhodanese-related sulfurtransferase